LFTFTAGIENSHPTIENGTVRIDFTWYPLTDQVHWDTALREGNGRVNALGLYDLDRHIRPAGEAYKQLIQRWRKVLPNQSVFLTVPAIPPSQYESAQAVSQLEAARDVAHGAPATQTMTDHEG
jgi:hypothetical protein